MTRPKPPRKLRLPMQKILWEFKAGKSIDTLAWEILHTNALDPTHWQSQRRIEDVIRQEMIRQDKARKEKR